MVLGPPACFTRRRSQVRVLSRPPFKSIIYAPHTQKQPTHLPTHIELLGESKARILRPWQRSLPSSSIQSDSAQMVQVPLATPSTSTSKASAADCLGRMHPRAGSKRSNVAAKAKYRSGSFISG